MGGSAHRHPEEIPLEPFLSAQVNGFCGAGSCLFAFAAGGEVTLADDGGRSQTKDVDTLVFVSWVVRASICVSNACRAGLCSCHVGQRRNSAGDGSRAGIDRGNRRGGDDNFAGVGPISCQ
jgi:hypothetical protein